MLKRLSYNRYRTNDGAARKRKGTQAMKTPTIARIEAAIAKADNMHGVYTCEEMPCVPGKFYVEHKNEADGTFIVYVTSAKHCSCPAFDRDAVCKHQAFLNQWNRIAEGEAEAEARAEYEEFGKHLLGCGPATHPSTGARFERIPLDRAEPRDW